MSAVQGPLDTPLDGLLDGDTPEQPVVGVPTVRGGVA